MDTINAFKLDLVQPLELKAPPEGTSAVESSSSFGNVLGQWVSKTDTTIQDANKTVQALVDGTLEHPHDAMIKLEQANLALQFTVQLRNKAVDAYNEIMRMQI